MGYSVNDPYKLSLGADVRGQYDLSKDTLDIDYRLH
jgi:hypothetical protein